MRHKHVFPIKKMCLALKVSRGGYYAWVDRPQSQRSLDNEKMLDRIKQIHIESNQVYGSPRITDTLRSEGFMVSRPRVSGGSQNRPKCPPTFQTAHR